MTNAAVPAIARERKEEDKTATVLTTPENETEKATNSNTVPPVSLRDVAMVTEAVPTATKATGTDDDVVPKPQTPEIETLQVQRALNS